MTIWRFINGHRVQWGTTTTTDGTPIDEYFHRRQHRETAEGPLIDGIPASLYTPIDYSDEEKVPATRRRRTIRQHFGNLEGSVTMERLPSSLPLPLPLPSESESESESGSFAPATKKRKLTKSENSDEEQSQASQASQQNQGQLQSGANTTLPPIYDEDSGIDPKMYFVKGKYDHIPAIDNRRAERIKLGNKNPTNAWLAYAVIAKTPGHKIKLSDMFKIIVDWYPDIVMKGRQKANESLRHALTVHKVNSCREFVQIKTEGVGDFWTVSTENDLVVDQKPDLGKGKSQLGIVSGSEASNSNSKEGARSLILSITIPNLDEIIFDKQKSNSTNTQSSETLKKVSPSKFSNLELQAP